MDRRSPWLLIEAAALVVLGVIAILFPLTTGVAATIFVGWLLLIVGILGLVSAFAGRDHAHLGWSVASAAIAVVAGLVLLFAPLAGVQALTILIAAYLLLDGVTLIGYSLDQRRRGSRSWAWTLASGVLDILLAFLIGLLGAAASAVLVGVIVGIDLIAAGLGLGLLHRPQRAI